MGVDITTQVGYGFAVSEEDWNQYLELNNLEDEYEAGYELAADRVGVSFTLVGNFWGDGAAYAVFYVDRLTSTYGDRRGGESGFWKLDTGSATSSEYHALLDIQELIGVAEKPGMFVAVTIS